MSAQSAADQIRDVVRDTGRNLSDAYTFKNARAAAGKMYDRAKASVNSYMSRGSSTPVKAAERAPERKPAAKPAAKRSRARSGR
jgi:hypothetical protein